MQSLQQKSEFFKLFWPNGKAKTRRKINSGIHYSQL